MKNNVKLSILLLIVSVLYSKGQEINKKKFFVLSDLKVNQLMAGDVCESVGLKERVMKHKRLSVQGWSKKEEVFKWPVKTNKKGKAEICLLVQAPVDNTVFVLSSSKETVKVKSARGWQRITTSLELNKNEDLITLGLENDIVGEKTASIISIEVITNKHLPTYKKQLQGFKDDLGDVSWFQEAGYGIMFQWGFWGYPKEGKERKPWKDVYRDFDIEAFADKMQKMNPGYLIWSITWRGSRYAMPLQSVDKIMGSKDFTMEYDFTGKLIDALNKRNIPVMFYFHPGHEEKEYWDKIGGHLKDRSKFVESNIAIWTEIGERYGKKLAGWFLDDGMATHYPTDFYPYVKALKAGHPGRLVSFNPWVLANCTPFEDVFMGEAGPSGKLENGYMTTGAYKGLMSHYMFIFDGLEGINVWGIFRPNQVIKTPPYYKNPSHWQNKVDIAKKTKSPMSFCIMMYEDGTLKKETVDLISKLKR